ncbi:hypothetical protein [Brevibacillus migulae]|uniref:hypothetical protein n=1 Tax=Brevibacillus migulae TaxID=1644114 RepID=UPI00106E924D|nr:hypothetical protein [Brevibacillus migulae]
MRLKTLGLAIALTVCLGAFASAAATYPYGDHIYGEKDIPLKGDLSYSGLAGTQTRPSIVYRHDIKIQNVITGAKTPSSGYLQTVQFDIQPIVGVDPNDAFRDKSGYHLIPVEEELIKDLATKANGNAQFVWSKVSTLSHPVVKQYFVNGVPYVNIGSIFHLSGGGNPDMRKAGGDGKDSPLFNTTYKSTPWPSIPILAQNADGSLHIKALAHSIYDTSITGAISVNGAASKQLFTKKSPISNYTVTYEGNVALTSLSGIKDGENTVTLTVTDTFGRTATKTITIQKTVISGCQPPLLKLNDFEYQISYGTPPATGVGGLVAWVVEYDAGLCTMGERTVGGLLSLNTVVKNTDKQYRYALHSWRFMVYQQSNNLVIKNKSSDSSPLVFRTSKNGKDYSVKKGGEVKIPLTKTLYFPSPLIRNGFWKQSTQKYDGYPAMYTIPADLKTAVQDLLKHK